MDHLSERQILVLREQLEQERARLLAELESWEGQIRAVDAEPDAQDAAVRDAERATLAEQVRHARARTREQELALERMREGVYGLCEDSEEEIPFPRLRAEPTARYTVEAAERLEARRGPSPTAARSDDDGP